MITEKEKLLAHIYALVKEDPNIMTEILGSCIRAIMDHYSYRLDLSEMQSKEYEWALKGLLFPPQSIKDELKQDAINTIKKYVEINRNYARWSELEVV